jgi:hypothetical protein
MDSSQFMQTLGAMLAKQQQGQQQGQQQMPWDWSQLLAQYGQQSPAAPQAAAAQPQSAMPATGATTAPSPQQYGTDNNYLSSMLGGAPTLAQVLQQRQRQQQSQQGMI